MTNKIQYNSVSEYVKYTMPPNIVKLGFKLIGKKLPKLFYDDEHKCIFIHIAKTGGVSVSKVLFGRSPGHVKIIEYELMDQHKFNQYFKFAIVRNPWSRLFSSYTYFKQGGKGNWDKKIAQQYLSGFSSFEDFVLSLKDKKLLDKLVKIPHFESQYKYVCDSNLKIKVDFIGKTENIENDFKYITEKIGVNCNLPHLNKSSKTQDYQEIYSEEMKKIVCDLYKIDIEMFNYHF